MLLIQESFVNRTEGYRSDDGEPYEPFTDNIGQLFRSLQREYGRCQSKVYVDHDGGVKAIGWVFVKKMPYEDTGELYEREVWVTLHDAPPTRTMTYHHHSLEVKGV